MNKKKASIIFGPIPPIDVGVGGDGETGEGGFY